MNLGIQDLLALAQVIVIDVALAGDNAVLIGLAASRVAARQRSRVVMWGIGGAVLIRVVLAAVATRLLAIIGLTLAGGVLLLWVCWKMYREFRHARAAGPPESAAGSAADERAFRNAVQQIIIADLSMSLDNVLAVAGAAKGNLVVLAVGLGLSILLTAIAAQVIARLLARHGWITWLGLAVVLYVALEMIWRGVGEVVSHTSH